MTKQYRIIWKHPKSYETKQTVWYSSEDQAERMREGLIRGGSEIIRREERVIS